MKEWSEKGQPIVAGVEESRILVTCGDKLKHSVCTERFGGCFINGVGCWWGCRRQGWCRWRLEVRWSRMYGQSTVQIMCAKKLVGHVELPFCFGPVLASIHFLSGLRIWSVKLGLEIAERKGKVRIWEWMDENYNIRSTKL